MTLQITPGTLDAQDGDRIHVDRVLSAFVSGTVVTNFGQADLRGAQINVVTSATDAPSDNDRSTLWFARGEGVLYKWTLNPTGDTGGRWVAMSTRREHLALVKNACLARSLVWPPTHVSEYNMSVGRHNRFTFAFAATEQSSHSRAMLIGPWGSVEVATSGDSFIPVTTMGYSRIRTANLAALTNFGKNNVDLDDLAAAVSDPYISSWSETGIGYLTESGASGAAEQNCFIFGESTGHIF